MPLRRAVRESAFNLARRDLATFLEEHEDRLRVIFHEEIQKLDDMIPEDQLFIDINMVGIGDVILTAVLHAMRRFLLETSSAANELEPVTPSKRRFLAEVKPVENVPFWKRKSRQG